MFMNNPIDVQEDAVLRHWEARGFHCGAWEDSPGEIWRNYIHATDELFMVLEGDVELELNGTTLRPQPGEEVLIPASVMHTLRNVGARPARWLYAYC